MLITEDSMIFIQTTVGKNKTLDYDLIIQCIIKKTIKILIHNYEIAIYSICMYNVQCSIIYINEKQVAYWETDGRTMSQGEDI